MSNAKFADLMEIVEDFRRTALKSDNGAQIDETDQVEFILS